MPKLKTHSGAKKRFKKLQSGRVKFSGSFRRHLLTSKSAKRKRHLRSPLYLKGADCKRIGALLPYQ
jgi:large subunit ribosomal protein L35